MNSQRGSFALGLIVGLLAGLALALGVALYITKVPVPFVNKVPHRSAEQDAAEIARNKDWDPNAPLAGKHPGRPASAPGVPDTGSSTGGSAFGSPSPPAVTTAPPAPNAPAASAVALPSAKASAAVAAASAASSSRGARDPAAILASKAASAAPKSTAAGPDAFVYFVQAGAYSRADDAEQQRAKLAMLGMDARVSEREQSGRTVFRVRLGPFERRDDAESAQSRLTESNVDANLVRVDR